MGGEMIDGLLSSVDWQSLAALAAVSATVLTAIGLIARWLWKLATPKKIEAEKPKRSRFEPPVNDNEASNNTVAFQDRLIERLNKRISELEAEIDRLRKNRAEDAAVHEKQIKLLEGQIAELRARIDNPSTAEVAFAEARKEATEVLEREGNELDADRVRAAEAAMEDGDFEAAKALFEELRAREELAVQRSARAAFALGEIAEAEVRWVDAADEFARAAELNPAFDHLFKAREYAWRAGRLPQALSLGEALLEVAKDAEPGRRSLALNEHALTLSAQGRFEEAEPLYREALEITCETLGERHPENATRLNNLASLLKDTGRFEEAEPLYREALEITCETLGERHPENATRLNNLASLLKDTGRFEEAEPLYREALEIRRETLGTRHPDYAQSLNNLALLLRATDRSEEAEPLYREALEIVEAALGPDHPNTQTVRKNFEIFLSEQK